ncbi:hypothetical protein EYF80_034683 [Liparis tanakae]|uniref:Uncharacterized protein n=1 Tax=Liparis tanakae TaxID=230148 RepID=A0A4Z2GP15_9TELE|nr:hypothetical protein EYF80_034683 [Liparis tanakae]
MGESRYAKEERRDLFRGQPGRAFALKRDHSEPGPLSRSRADARSPPLTRRRGRPPGPDPGPRRPERISGRENTRVTEGIRADPHTASLTGQQVCKRISRGCEATAYSAPSLPGESAPACELRA